MARWEQNDKHTHGKLKDSSIIRCYSLAAGRAPPKVSTFLAGRSLTALNKSKSGSIMYTCPIAVGESLHRWVGKCLCAAGKTKAAGFFKPFQFDVVCLYGTEKIAHGLRACIENHWLDDDFVVLKKVDMKNAFRMVSRQALLFECSTHVPEILPWACWCYTCSQQGDPLGPLLFTLVLNILVSKITSNGVCADLSYHAWYLDDGV